MRQTFLSWLTDRIILEPSRHEIAVAQKRRLLLRHGEGQLEVWVHRAGPGGEKQKPDLYVLKFPGTASRAEDSSDLVDSCWPDLNIEVWAVNPPGYGGSSGAASLRHIPSMASRALDELKPRALGRPLVIAGGSLGCVSALYLAARNDHVDGLLLQNPPALREVIHAQSAWWHFAWARSLIARQIPAVLDSIKNASEARAPAVFLVALQDRIVPAIHQRQIIEAYAGPKQVLDRPDADHDTPLHAADVQELQSLATWLKQSMGSVNRF
jgi:pimeloyl-ACP methyl ester carboxylesterase